MQVTNLSKKFGSEIILENLNFSIDKGQVISITGESGRGKTTFLRCLVGLEKINSGSIKIGDQFLVKNGIYVTEKQKQQVLKNVGFVFQNFNLFNNLTVIKNIEVPLKNKKMDPEKIRGVSQKLIKRFQLEGRENFYPKSLSGGQKQRVAIARTLALSPKIILFDEPTSALDDKLTDEIYKIIKQLAKEGYSIIIVTHETDFANKVSDIVLELKNRKFTHVNAL